MTVVFGLSCLGPFGRMHPPALRSVGCRALAWGGGARDSSPGHTQEGLSDDWYTQSLQSLFLTSRPGTARLWSSLGVAGPSSHLCTDCIAATSFSAAPPFPRRLLPAVGLHVRGSILGTPSETQPLQRASGRGAGKRGKVCLCARFRPTLIFLPHAYVIYLKLSFFGK